MSEKRMRVPVFEGSIQYDNTRNSPYRCMKDVI